MHDREQDGVERGRIRASGIRISNEIGIAGNKERGEAVSVALTIEVVACVSKGWERASG